MIAASSAGDWSLITRELRKFVSRRVSSSADVDDILQDTYLRVQRGIGQLRDDDAFGGWIYQVARSVMLDHFRSRRPSPEVAQDVAAFEQAEDAERLEIEQCVATYIASQVSHLPALYQEAIQLTELQGKTQVDAARELGISVSGMKSRVQRARQQLADMVSACCNIELDVRGRVISCESRIKPDCDC